MELLGKIMAQVLSILALSTKAITGRRMSELIHVLSFFSADYEPEKFLKRLIGKTDVEDALVRLDSLTKEERLMAMAKNFEVVHHVKALAEDIDGKVQVLERAVKERTQWFYSSSYKY
jgi:hypothetical protein